MTSGRTEPFSFMLLALESAMFRLRAYDEKSFSFGGLEVKCMIGEL
jgi:hypothetical protein